MRIAITGEKGFIAQNLIEEINQDNRDTEFVSLDNSSYADTNMIYTANNEVCVHSNSESAWADLFRELEIDCIIHNAAVVGTDVVALNPSESIMTNVLGTQNITNAANQCNILNTYIGTTVIYDTYKYQDSMIKEDSDIFPRTHYAVQKYAGEMTVRNSAKEWLVMRPLFAYGGVGDPNSLIAKSLYSAKNNKNIDMFLDPLKKKDYMHVSDFCDAVINAVTSDIRNQDFNVSVENPYTTQKIVDLMSEVCGYDVKSLLKWHPKTDYLGNHLLSCDKFSKVIGFTNDPVDIELGIKFVWDAINNDRSQYNPLRFLEEAQDKNLDLLDFFPKTQD